MDNMTKEGYRLTIFREGNKTAKHIPEFVDFIAKEQAQEQIKKNRLDEKYFSATEMLKIENEDGEAIVIPRTEFVGYQLKKVLL
jgi:hypothetical protein